MRIGFIGLGVMGHSMAGHLLNRHRQLVVWSRTREKAVDLVERGATLADTPAALAAQCDAVCICVADTPDVEDVVFGGDGVHAGLKRGSMVIDFSTISAARTEEFAARVADKGCSWVDAPLSGGDIGARNATLTIMIGASDQDYRRALPIFEAVGKTIVHMGPVGSGQRTKMANQIAVCGTLASMGEAMVFARRMGMDVEKVLSVIGSGAAGSWSMTNYAPRVLKGNFDPGFSVRLMAKDLRLVAEAMESLDADFPVTRLYKGLFESMEEEGDGARGIHAVVRKMGWEESEG